MDDAHEWHEVNDNQVRNRNKWKDLMAFWIFGLCNNYGYVVMLTAAEDIIGRTNVSIKKFLNLIKIDFKMYF